MKLNINKIYFLDNDLSTRETTGLYDCFKDFFD